MSRVSHTARSVCDQLVDLGNVYTEPVPNGSGPKMIGLLFTRDLSGTGPERTCCFASPVLYPFRTSSRKVSGKHLDRFQTVPCKQKPIRAGSVRNGSSPVPCKHSPNLHVASMCKILKVASSRTTPRVLNFNGTTVYSTLYFTCIENFYSSGNVTDQGFGSLSVGNGFFIFGS